MTVNTGDEERKMLNVEGVIVEQTGVETSATTEILSYECLQNFMYCIRAIMNSNNEVH